MTGRASRCIGVSFGADDGSDIRRRLAESFDALPSTCARRSDREIAAMLRELEVDIAVDLKGYTQDSRPEILAHRPAPIQVELSRLSRHHRRGFHRLHPRRSRSSRRSTTRRSTPRRSSSCPIAIRSMTASARSPRQRRRGAEAGLPETGFVFCCFNNNYKIRRPVFDDLDAAAAAGARQRAVAAARQCRRRSAICAAKRAARGIDPARLVFAGRAKLEDHLARHRLADLFLDTLPYNAHTTASDALWTACRW